MLQETNNKQTNQLWHYYKFFNMLDKIEKHADYQEKKMKLMQKSYYN